jgi:predicted ester cyclase
MAQEVKLICLRDQAQPLRHIGTTGKAAKCCQDLIAHSTHLFRSNGVIAMTRIDLVDTYRGYIACLNRQDWATLGQFVHDEASRNGERLGLSGYRKMLENDFDEIPDLHFNIELLISDPPHIASRLQFDCRPKGRFLGLDVMGKRVSFTENVFYEFRSEKIWQVWSVIDKAAIESQL